MIINLNDRIDFIYSTYGFLLYKKNMMTLFNLSVKENLVINNENFWSFIFDVGQYINENEQPLIDSNVYLNEKPLIIDKQLMSIMDLTNSGRKLFESKDFCINEDNIVKMPLIDVMSIIGDKMFVGNVDFPYTKDNLIEIVL